MIPPETPTKRTKRSIEERQHEAALKVAALKRQADEAGLKGTQHGHRLYRARSELTALLALNYAGAGVADAQDALASVNASIEKCLEVVRGGGA